VYTDELGTGSIGWVHQFEVVSPNFRAPHDYWGKVDNCRHRGGFFSSRW
jgi:hypothetical protein